MYTITKIALVAAALACPCLHCLDGRDGVAAAALTDERSDRVTFYHVPLTCPAARGLGCGSRAKPVLLDLERTTIVEEAWLDQTGQTMAIVWTPASAAGDRKSALTAVLESRELSVEELSGQARTAAFTAFPSGKGWHRGADVDLLSEEEAVVIADRLLVRLVARAPSANAKMSALRSAFTETIRQQLIAPCPSLSECRDKMLAAARQHLTEVEVAALKDAIELGYRPIESER